MQTKQTRLVYKILDQAAAQRSELDRTDGYIHLSAATQISGTLARYYNGSLGVTLLEFAVSDVADRLKWETSRNGDLFPHYYGALPRRLATRMWKLVCSADAPPLLPESLNA
ncbi:MAG: DUF952 domain-containing protein [Henriciella sp.]